MAPDHEDEQETTLDAEEDAEGRTPGEREPGQEPARPSSSTGSKPSVGARYRSEIRIAIISAVAAVLVGAVFSPVGDWTGGAADQVRDFFRGYDGKRLDDMKETIEDRPYWQDGPSFKAGAFEYIDETDIGESTYTTLNSGSTTPRVIGVDELVDNAPNADPDPVILVGEVFDESSVQANGDFPYIDREVVLLGRERFVYVGTDSRSYSWNGLAAYVGVLIATGRVLDEDVPSGVETAYFIGVQGLEVGPNNPVLRPKLEVLAPDEFR